MAGKRIEQKVKQAEENERALKLHTNSCDKLYRWSMWRMYLNEELSRAISTKQDYHDHSKSVNRVTSPYLEHPDGKKYGRQMKKLFRHHEHSTFKEGNLEILPDNAYLVFGLPRVSLSKQMPESVKQLHKSTVDLSNHTTESDSGYFDKKRTPEDEISEMFRYIDNSSSTCDSSSQGSSKETVHKDREKHTNGTHSAEKTNGKSYLKSRRNKGHLKGADIQENNFNSTSAIETGNVGDSSEPLVSKSRLFWEKLSNKKADIVKLEGSAPNNDSTHKKTKPLSLHDEILQRQQKILRNPVSNQPRKDLWRTIRERKTEILQMRDSESGVRVKREQSKTSQLWSFIFHRKKDLIQMKRGMHAKNHIEEQNERITPNRNVDPAPTNFEDCFQKELAEKLRKRRLQETENSEYS